MENMKMMITMITSEMTGVGWVWFLSPLLSCFVLINELGYPPLSIWENILASVPLGFALGNWLTYLFACYEGTINEEGLKKAAGVCIAISAIGMWRCLRRLYTRRLFLFSELKTSFLPLFSLLLISLLLFWPLFNSHYLQGEGETVKSAGSTWGDIPLHLDIINSFVKGENSHLSFWELPKSPIFAGDSLQYSFFPDFHSSCLILSGLCFY